MKQLKKLAQIMIVCCGLTALSACSHLNHNKNATGDDVDSAGVQASGTGEGDSFADNNANGSSDSSSLVSKKTYYFDFDQNVVHDADKPAIIANADYLVAHSNVHIVLAGHTDPRGSREYNVALGERRANAVLDLLKSHGVKDSQIRVVSYGQERLASPGRTEQDYQLDRRAVIEIGRG